MQPQPDTHRLFFALWPDEALRREVQLISARLEREHDPGGRPMQADKYHMTLQFLGDFRPLPELLVPTLFAAVESVKTPSFDLQLDTAGSFRGARVWWLGTREVPAALTQLYDTLGQALQAADVRTQSHEHFSPHLTLRRNVRRFISGEPVPPLRWHVREFGLVDSHAGQYTLLRRWPLQG